MPELNHQPLLLEQTKRLDGLVITTGQLDMNV